MKAMHLKIKFGFFAVFMLCALAIASPQYFPALICSVAIHESGHIIMARLCKVPLYELKLGIFGAALSLADNVFSYKSEILICSGGPIFNFISAFVAWRFITVFDTSLFVMSSIALGALNMLPIVSFDGGRILSSVLHMIFSVRLCEILCKLISFIFIFLLWSLSVYLLIKVGASLTLFVFSASTFAKIFIPDAL